jgi:prepilin-type N-terminal cleavage/methylation domain-containing protein/prepilin-type processing-associated H-X9-DG protein
MSTRRPEPRIASTKAFTLVELLVVIGIIAILVALLLPTLAGARRAADNLKCQATIRELGIALRLYAQTYNGYMPPARQGKYDFHHGSVQMNDAWCFWWMRLQQQRLIPGLDDPTRGVAVCPSDDTPYWPYHEFPDHKNLQSSYGLNPFMSVATDGAGPDQFHPEFPKRAPLGVCDLYGHRQRKVLGVKNAPEVILVMEIREAWFGNWYAPNTFEAAQTGSEWFDWDWYRHTRINPRATSTPGSKIKGRSNVCWLDGHVTTVRQGVDQYAYLKNDVYSAGIGPVGFGGLGAAVTERGKRQWAWLPPVD